MEDQYIEVINEDGSKRKISVKKGPVNKEMQVIYGLLEEGMQILAE